MNETIFERMLLREVAKIARGYGAAIRDAWVIQCGKTWEFHYREFYWWGRAENAWDARAKGWEAWLKSKGIGSPAGCDSISGRVT